MTAQRTFLMTCSENNLLPGEYFRIRLPSGSRVGDGRHTKLITFSEITLLLLLPVPHPVPVNLRVVCESIACVDVILIQVSGLRFTIFAGSVIKCLYLSVVLVIYLFFFFNREDKRIPSAVNLKITNSGIGQKRLSSGNYLTG